MGHPGVQIWQEASEGTQTNCFLVLELLKKEESVRMVSVWLRFGGFTKCVLMVARVRACTQMENTSFRRTTRFLPLNNQLFYVEVSVHSGEPASLFILKKILIHN